MQERDDSAVAREVAEAEFERFLDAMDLKIGLVDLDDEDKASLAAARSRIVGEIVRGRVVVDEDGQPRFTTSEGHEVVFYEPKGSTFMAADKRKDGHNIAKMYAILAEMTRESPARFANMKGRDIKTCQAILLLFLG